MSEMMVLGFENEMEADRFGLKLAELQKDMIVQLGDAAEVIRDPDGKPHVKHGDHIVGAGAMGGAFWGMLFGLLFFMPFLGLAIGAGMGALFGKMGKTGIDKQILEQMGDAIPPGKAGWFLIINQMTEDKFLAAVEGTNAKLVRSNLTAEQEEQLKHAFGAKHHKKQARRERDRLSFSVERHHVRGGAALPGSPPRLFIWRVRSESARHRKEHKKGRLEAFSDGVFAIAITLLVLEIAVPHVTGTKLLGELWHERQMILAYFVAFMTIGAVWIEHSALVDGLEKVDNVFMRLNLLLLLFCALLPFPTKLMGEYAGDKPGRARRRRLLRHRAAHADGDALRPRAPRREGGPLRRRPRRRGEGGVAAQVPAGAEPHLLRRRARPGLHLPVPQPRRCTC